MFYSYPPGRYCEIPSGELSDTGQTGYPTSPVRVVSGEDVNDNDVRDGVQDLEELRDTEREQAAAVAVLGGVAISSLVHCRSPFAT